MPFRGDPKATEVLVGTNQRNSGGKPYKVEKFIVHEEYKQKSEASIVRSKDIALIRVKGPIEFNEKVQSINYYTKEIPPGTVLQLTGWGRLSVSILMS